MKSPAPCIVDADSTLTSGLCWRQADAGGFQADTDTELASSLPAEQAALIGRTHLMSDLQLALTGAAWLQAS